MERQLMTKEVVEELDILCASYLPPINMPEVKKIEVITESHSPQTLEEHTDLNDFRLIGIDLEGTIAPYITKGHPLVEGEWIKGMRFWDRTKEVMRFLNPNVWACQIRAKDSFVYFGCREGVTLLMFEKPIPFDPTKDFLYVRSPNGKFAPQHVLATKKLEEQLILGEWIVLEEDGKEKAVDYHFCDQSLSDLYYKGRFNSLIKIYGSAEEVFLEYEQGGKPIMKKNPDGISWSPIGNRFRPVRKFSLPANISTFNPLTFSPSQHQEIKRPSPKEKGSESEYSLVYISPAELTLLRWGFNSKIMESMSGGISRHHNQHLL